LKLNPGDVYLGKVGVVSLEMSLEMRFTFSFEGTQLTIESTWDLGTVVVVMLLVLEPHKLSTIHTNNGA